MTPRIEEMVKEFDERFGGNAPDIERYLCLYNSALGYSDHHQVVRDFLIQALTEAYQAGRDEAVEIVEALRDDPKGSSCLDCMDWESALDDTIKALQDK